MASRVVPSILETITRSSPKIAFVRDDLPTFGLPIIEKLISSSLVSSSCKSYWLIIWSNKSPIPIPCEPETGIGSPTPNA